MNVISYYQFRFFLWRPTRNFRVKIQVNLKILHSRFDILTRYFVCLSTRLLFWRVTVMILYYVLTLNECTNFNFLWYVIMIATGLVPFRFSIKFYWKISLVSFPPFFLLFSIFEIECDIYYEFGNVFHMWNDLDIVKNKWFGKVEDM